MMKKTILQKLKNITGNSINDNELLKFGKLNEKLNFKKKIKNLYSR